MISTNLMPLDDMSGCPFPFFGNGEKIYKIYNDGENYVATLCWRKLKRGSSDTHTAQIPFRKISLTEQQKEIILRRIMRGKRKAVKGKLFLRTSLKVDIGSDFGGRSDIDILFDSLYYQTIQKGWNYRYNKSDMLDFIKSGIEKLFPDYENLDKWIDDKIKRKLNNLLHRKKRFRRKAYLNPWNYFVTFTYDDKKQTEETFKKRLRKCLSNLHTRRGWKYMGVFEHAPETGRLHFHGLLYVPVDEMVGTITEKSDYSTAKHEMQTYCENDFFKSTFGRNDFQELSAADLKSGRSVDYIIKYIGKTGERVCYSRGIPTEFYKKLDSDDIITGYTDFVQKYILFNRAVNYERDILQKPTYKQVKMFISQSGNSYLIA